MVERRRDQPVQFVPGAEHAYHMVKEQRPQGGRIINNGSVRRMCRGATRRLRRDYDIACGQIDIGNAPTSRNEDTARGRLQATGRVEAEPRMDPEQVSTSRAP
jgi:hypothetical protein